MYSTNKNYKICFSIPVHEAPDVVNQQISNIHHFNPDSIVVLHKSLSFNTDVVFNEAVVNPNRFETQWGNSFVRVHFSNFKAVEEYNFEYFCVLASNELFFKHGAYDYMKQFDGGTQYLPETGVRFPRVIDLCNKHPTLSRVSSQIEGIFMKKYIVKELIDSMNIDYTEFVSGAEEEVLFSTWLSDSKYKNGYPITWFGGLISRFPYGEPWPELVETLHNWEKVPEDRQDSYHSRSIFSVKRVPRNMDAPLRQYLLEKQRMETK